MTSRTPAYNDSHWSPMRRYLASLVLALALVIACASGAWATQRNAAPLATDDTTSGYAVGDFWQFGGQVWKASNVSSGAAVWDLQTVSSLPADAVTGAAGVYGVSKLRSAYAGNAFQVRRASDTTTSNIGWDGNGVANWAAVDTFCASTSCTVSIWYDQSGNGYDLAQGTAGYQPSVISTTINGKRAITFAGQKDGSRRYLQNTSLPITSAGAMSVLFIGRNSTMHDNEVLYEIGAPTSKFIVYTQDNQGVTLWNGGTTVLAGAPWLASENASLLISNAGTNVYRINDKVLTPSFTGSGSATGVSLGLTSAALDQFRSDFDALGFMVYNSALNSTQQTSLLASVYKTFGMKPQSRDSLSAVGDSITAGLGVEAGNTYLSQADATYSKVYRIENMALSGETAATMASETSTVIPVLGGKSANKVVIVSGGSNDVQAGTSAASILTSVQSIASAFRTAGFKVLVGTVIARSTFDSPKETVRTTFNSSVRTNTAAWHDGVVDFGGDSILGNSANTGNTTYFQDGTHPTPAGAARMATILYSALQAQIADQFIVTTSAGSNGTVTASQLVTSGSTATITATPSGGYDVDTWGGTCSGTGTGNTRSLSAVSADCTVTVSFKTSAPVTHAVTTSAGAGGTISGNQTINDGSTATVTATPSGGYHVNAWAGTCGGTASGTGNVTYTTSAVTADCTVSVSFAQDVTYTVTGSSLAGGTINHSDAETVTSGSASRSYACTPTSGNILRDIRVNGSTASSSSPYTISSVAADSTVECRFWAPAESVGSGGGRRGGYGAAFYTNH